MNKKEAVILLHGLARSRFSLLRLQWVLSRDYQVVNLGYPSRSADIQALASAAIESAIAKCSSATKIHIVTHSLGGILVRQFLAHNHIDKLGRVVMLGPPNQGSELVDAFRSNSLLAKAFDTINGPAGKQLGTSLEDKPKSLGPVNFELGVIAGNVNRNPVFKTILPESSDGKVTVASTKVEGMTDHLELDVDHTFMMNDKRVIKACQQFLEHGRFLS